MNRVAFDTYIETQLAPTLNRGDVVILDNLAVHKSAKAAQCLKEKGAWFLFLPPYSPDLNPIEPLFGKLKGSLRGVLRDAEAALWQLVGQGLETITAADLTGWFHHCGYRNTQS